MSAPPPIECFAVSSEMFVRAAAAHDVRPAAALQHYRAIFRDDAPLPPWASRPALTPGTIDVEGATRKFLLVDPHGLEIESVILPQRGSAGRERVTLCLSSQIGCAMGCTFCETAQMGRIRQLTAAEIVAQWHAARHVHGAHVDNLVFMGMGEPMDNLDAVIAALEVLTDDNGPAIGPSRISISTVGRADGIRRLAACARRPGWRGLKLAVSVNAPNDAIRSEIMPVNRHTPLDALFDAIAAWPADPRRRVLLEYVVIPGVNDDPAHARELCARVRARDLPATINVIPYNPRRDSPWPAPDDATVTRFVEAIAATGQRVRRRRTLGRDVMAACGQLGNEHIRGRRRDGQPVTVRTDVDVDSA